MYLGIFGYSDLNTIFNSPESALGCTDSNAWSNTAVQDDGTCSYDWQANYDSSGNSVDVIGHILQKWLSL